jgi:hypothetical protein
VGGTDFLAVRISTARVDTRCDVLIVEATVNPPAILINGTADATITIQQMAPGKEVFRVCAMKERVLQPMTQANFAPDDATDRQPSLQISVGGKVIGVVKIDEATPRCLQYDDVNKVSKELHVVVFNHPVTDIRCIMCVDSVGDARFLMGTVRVFRQKFTLEDAIGSHACSLEALADV